MKDRIASIARAALVVGLTSAFAIAVVFAADPDASFRESQRTQIQSNLYAVAVAFPGNVTIASNATVSGEATVHAAATLNTVSATGSTFTVAALNPTFAATQLVFSAAAPTAPTNLVSGAGVGLRVRINGTNYLIRATLN
jgi:hypothetical protein